MKSNNSIQLTGIIIFEKDYIDFITSQFYLNQGCPTKYCVLLCKLDDYTLALTI